MVDNIAIYNGSLFTFSEDQRVEISNIEIIDHHHDLGHQHLQPVNPDIQILMIGKLKMTMIVEIIVRIVPKKTK